MAPAWLGHSTIIASKHYWQVTDADFERAAMTPSSTVQNPAQQVHEMGCKVSQADIGTNANSRSFPVSATCRKSLQDKAMGGTGFEPVTSTV